MTELAAAIVLIAEALAKRAGRWDHATKVIELVRQVPGVGDVGTVMMVVLAWLHDVFDACFRLPVLGILPVCLIVVDAELDVDDLEVIGGQR